MNKIEVNRTTNSIVHCLSWTNCPCAHTEHFNFFFIFLFFFSIEIHRLYFSFIFSSSLFCCCCCVYHQFENSSQNGRGTQNCQYINPFFVVSVLCVCACISFLFGCLLVCRGDFVLFFPFWSSFTRSRKEIPSPLPSPSLPSSSQNGPNRVDWTCWRRMSTEEKEMSVWHWTVIGF